MITEVRLPKMGTSMEEAIVVRWLKTEGDHVDEGEDLVEVTTDKINAIVPSPATGLLTSIVITPNETVPIRTVLAYIESS